MDTVDKATRSRIMSRVGQKDTGAETMLRYMLHKARFRYRLHDRRLPGSPDVVFPRFGAVIFVHGCYWHSHGCYKSTVPKSRRKFWTEKFNANQQRDDRNVRLLMERGWRVMIVWECALLGKTALPAAEVTRRAHVWLHGLKARGQVSGTATRGAREVAVDVAGFQNRSSSNRHNVRPHSALRDRSPEEFARDEKESSAAPLRTVLAGQQMLAGRSDATRSGLSSKTRRSFGHPQKRVKGGRKNL
ncbi:MAG: very short patch repair endonuclease [Candidatus Binataceae bacterium]